MSGRTCFFEGCEAPAPFGLGFPGLQSKLPKGRRGTLWHCKEHAPEAEARREKAMIQIRKAEAG